MSLNNAAKMYVGDQKDDGIDRARLGRDRDYWREKSPEILEYCLQDCALTAKLGEVLQNGLKNSIKFIPSKYISKAYISKKYFQINCKIPDLRKTHRMLQEMAYNSYYGGRFECTERGYLGECMQIDINSAYPYQIANLIDVTRGRWSYARSISPESYYGFYDATVVVPPAPFCPLPFRLKHGLVIFPAGEFTGVYTREELLMAKKYGARVKINFGIEFTPEEIFHPFRTAIMHLYAEKARSPKKSMEYTLYKIMMNSFYGVNFEKTLVEESWNAGILFNPIYASIITAGTRCALFEEAMRIAKETTAIPVSFATDSILVRGEIDEINSKELGVFAFDSAGECIIVKSGLYKLSGKTKRRGVGRSDFSFTTDDMPGLDGAKCYDPFTGTTHTVTTAGLIDVMCSMTDTKLPISVTRPLHFREGVIQHKRDKINLFEEHISDLDINNDRKRIWDFKFNAGTDLNTARCGSSCLIL